MDSKILVNILCSTPHGCDINVTTMVAKTVRIGFPTANLLFHSADDATTERLNEITHTWDDDEGFEIIRAPKLTQHQFIGYCLHACRHCADHPIVILDGDVIFWDSVEWWATAGKKPLSGFYVPTHLSEYSRSLYMERLHTSFLWISSFKELDDAVNNAAKWMKEDSAFADYKNWLAIDPHYSYVSGRPVYWDVCAEMYNLIGGTHFPFSLLDCYDHVNSASFYPSMRKVFANKPLELAGFDHVHHIAAHNTGGLKGLYREIQQFYTDRAFNFYDYLNAPWGDIQNILNPPPHDPISQNTITG